ncbi:putative membrane-anchored protein [Undibacterium sp. GrIS 1.2]
MVDYSKLNHPLRVPLSAEIHSRPFLQLETPENLTHFALYIEPAHATNLNPRAQQHRILQELCLHYGVPGPHSQARYFFHDFGRFRLKWEFHTEFATYTFVERRTDRIDWQQAFQHLPLRHVPQEWLAGLQGKIIVAAHVVLNKSLLRAATEISDMRYVFEGDMLVGSHAGNGGVVWTDFLIQPDGFSRFVVHDIDLKEFQAGRLIGRLLEIETYRTMALLALPQAEATQPQLTAIEKDLATLIVAMEQSDQDINSNRSPDDNGYAEENLLRRITGIAARIEKLSVNNGYRFSASQAYFNLVQSRIQELREGRIEGIPMLAEFMGRRLTPAMNTCTSVTQRQETLATRIARSNDLLRTRVSIEQERQNSQILNSLNARSAQQLRVQQAVEGLSVVALSYYLIGLIGYISKALKAANLPINPDILNGVMAPVVAFGVWHGISKLHKKLKSSNN